MIDLIEYGYHGDDENAARVTAVHRDRWEIAAREGVGFAVLKGSAYQGDAPRPAVGDFVRVRWNPLGDSVITETLPRFSVFERSDDGGHHADFTHGLRAQVVAANFDYVFIVSSLNGDLNPARLERYLTLSWNTGATPVILLTKLDLCPDAAPYIERVRAVAGFAAIHAVSSRTGERMDALARYLCPGKTSIFIGMSGVGKSSLLNALAGESLMRVNQTRAVDSAKGRHTTTHRQLFVLPSGAIVIDTPGMRELGMWNVSGGLESAFPEVEELAARCRFRDCTHHAEPGCAVREALESGALPRKRWQAYEALQREARFAELKAATHGRYDGSKRRFK
ncbi:MAG: ribosome small subunit-dependent GTPase A [Eubacteriales bacterium]|nr:ribosome small subunit-dependent GTPase A [Eubacteriales bacterium]